jgi:hypothetical protein
VVPATEPDFNPSVCLIEKEATTSKAYFCSEICHADEDLTDSAFFIFIAENLT